MNCIFLKKKINKKLECKLDKNKIIPKSCENCTLKEYNCKKLKKNYENYHFPYTKNVIKNTFVTESLKSKYKLKQKSNKLAKLEKNRSSLFTKNKDKCMFCDSTYHLTWHEIYRGRNRFNSIKYKLCLRMCKKCHDKYQENKEFNNYWHKKGQLAFITNYPNLRFENIFKINYLD